MVTFVLEVITHGHSISLIIYLNFVLIVRENFVLARFYAHIIFFITSKCAACVSNEIIVLAMVQNNYSVED